MTYYILRQDMSPDAWAVRAGDDLDFMMFRAGKKLQSMPEPVSIELADESRDPSDYLESPYFIVSDAMREALTAFGVDNIDYYEAILHNSEGQYNGYWLGNIIGLVACVDESKSDYKQLSGSKRILRGFVVDEAGAKGVHLFRLKENRRLVLISERLRDDLRTNGLRGIYFQDTRKFDGKPASTFWEEQ